jgi:LAO/AO transport system kinase
MGLAEKILEGDEKSAARLISLIEDGEGEGYRQLALLLPHTKRSHVIGITGPPGAGKSTLTGRLAIALLNMGKKVAVVATDPTSLRGKGAFLGYRVRMKEADKKQIFIRSMAHRGYPGGVARGVTGAIHVLEALGKDAVIVESAGAGQSEKELFYICDTVVTVYTPDYGDEIQLLKAGLMEIGDILVVNKSDQPGAENAEREILACVAAGSHEGRQVPVLVTSAYRGVGIEELAGEIVEHWKFLKGSGRLERRRKENVRSFTMALLKEGVWNNFIDKVSRHRMLDTVLERVDNREIDPYSAVEEILHSTEFTVWSRHEES